MPKTWFEPGRGQRVPVYLWARDASPEVITQLERIASRPYVSLRVAAMADAHVAEGVAVGTVFATSNTVVPRALGGDLGCGVTCAQLVLGRGGPAPDRATLQRAVDALVRAVPAGDRVHRAVDVPAALYEGELSTSTLERTRDALAKKHLGTLGGGNHFLEIDRDAEGGVWMLVHSGSRGLGAAIAAHHVRAAEALDPDPLAGMDAASRAGAAYLADSAWALRFAHANRAALLARAVVVLSDVLDVDVGIEDTIDIHHNFVARERWDDHDLFVHRKGAVAVPAGTRAIIPGSMATASYIVAGLGSPLAFGSCSHGAGRVMSRREARLRVRPESLAHAMRRIAWPAHLKRHLVEEAPAVYRDIGEVLDDQRDLVERVLRLEPLAVLKG